MNIHTNVLASAGVNSIKPLQGYKKTVMEGKKSLAGTVLEIIDKDSMFSIGGNKSPNVNNNIHPQKQSVPGLLTQRNPDKDQLEKYKLNYFKQKRQLAEAEQQLLRKKLEALEFTACRSPDDREVKNCTGISCTVKQKKLKDTPRSVKTVRLDPTARDKMNSKLSVSSTNLRQNMFENTRQENSGKKYDRNRLHEFVKRQAAYKENRNKGWQRERIESPDVNKEFVENETNRFIDLPLNIKHKFGSKICDQLFSSPELVAASVDKLKTKSVARSRLKEDKSQRFPVNLDDSYEGLGQIIRCDIFPGLTTGHRISHSQSKYNGQKLKKAENNSTAFHHKRDELLIWSEQNLFRERLKKAWDEKYSSAAVKIQPPKPV